MFFRGYNAPPASGDTSSASPGGSSTQLQYRVNASTFGGTTGADYDTGTNRIRFLNPFVIRDGSFNLTISATPTANRAIAFPDASGTVALIAGSDKQIIFNDGGALGANAGLKFDKTLGSLHGAGGTSDANRCFVWGPNAEAHQDDSVAIGDGAIATGVLCHAIGYDAQATQTYTVALGAHTRASGVAAIAIGENSVASGINASTLGFNCTASAYGAVALGLITTASGDGSTALGFSTAALRTGELAHSGGAVAGVTSSQWNALDMMADANAAPTALSLRGGDPLILTAYTVLRLTVKITAVKYHDGSVIASELHHLVVSNLTGPTTTIRTLTIADDDPPGGFAAVGWGVSWSAPGSQELRLTFDPGADRVAVYARIEWAAVWGVSP